MLERLVYSLEVEAGEGISCRLGRFCLEEETFKLYPKCQDLFRRLAYTPDKSCRS